MPASVEREELPLENTKTMPMHMWRAIRRNNPYRFEERTYPGDDRRFWTRTQAVLWTEFYETMQMKPYVKPKVLNTDWWNLYRSSDFSLQMKP